MIIVDCETTGLIENEALPLAQQPRIIELGLIRCHDVTGAITNRYGAFVNPGIPIPPEVTKVTGITDADVATAPPFVAHLCVMLPMFLGEEIFLAHNANFDHMMLVFELSRIGKQYRFPYPANILDSKTRFSGKLIEWGKKVLGDSFVQTHRALDDAELLHKCWFSGIGDDDE